MNCFRVFLCASLGAVCLHAETIDVTSEQSALIPKRETGVPEFLEKYPDYDGRDVVIAVFDTGVDPQAEGLQVTTTGARKIVDVIDASGSGDTDMSKQVEPDQENNTVKGLTGRTLTLPKDIKNPSGKYRIGFKRGSELFHKSVLERVKRVRRQALEQKYRTIENKRIRDREAAEQKGERKAFSKAEDDRSLEEKDRILREEMLTDLEKGLLEKDPGPVFDCVVWNNGEHYHVIIDTDEDGDLADEKILRPFGIDGEYADFGDRIASTFAVQVYEEGKLLSIVTVSGSHGSHCAAIAAAHFPDARHRDGIAPGARILSIKIGDQRMGGSSNGTGEMRAAATCAQYGADIMNASWGGATSYQDGSSIQSRLYNMLAEKYGVTAFVSVGNDGPALSTLGSPGGEAHSVIGCGAYVSDEMGRVLYNQVHKTPNTAYHFSSRGPGKNGDMGVDVMAPGGAVASLAFDALQGSERYNGTSMSAPSLAGIGALLVSGAKQAKIPYSPARIRRALMNGAKYIDEVEPFAQGAGLAQTLPAWEHLEKTGDETIWDNFFTISTEDNTYSEGPGLYLREPVLPGKKAVEFKISPRFPAKAKNKERFEFAHDLLLSTTADWIEAPKYMRIESGNTYIRPILDIPETNPGEVLFGEIHAHLASNTAAGPVFRIPITIIPPILLDRTKDYRHDLSIEIQAGQTERRFFEVPPRTSQLKLRVELEADDRLDRRVDLHAVTPVTNRSYRDTGFKRSFDLKPGKPTDVIIPVIEGKSAELAFHQVWSTEGKCRIKAELQFTGVRLKQEEIVFRENEKVSPFKLESQFTEEVTFSGEISNANYSILPVKTEWLLPDIRNEYPPGPKESSPKRETFLRQEFHFTAEAPMKIRLVGTRAFDRGHDLTDSFVTAIHESGKILHEGYELSGLFSLPKGKTSFYRYLRGEKSLLKKEEARPLRIRWPLSKKPTLSVYESPNATIYGKDVKELTLRPRRNYSLMAAHGDISKLHEIKPEPDYFHGELRIRQEDETLAKARVYLRLGQNFKEVTNKKPKAAPREKKEKPLEKFSKDLFDRKLAFVKASRATRDKEQAKQRDVSLSELIKEEPENPNLYLEKAIILAGQAGLLSEWHFKAPAKKTDDDDKKDEKPASDIKAKSLAGEKSKVTNGAPASKEALSFLNKARKLSQPSKVARFFGARPDQTDATLDDKKKESQQAKEMEKHRSRLTQIDRLKSDILLHRDKLEASRKALRYATQWEEKPSDLFLTQEVALLSRETHYAVAMKKLDALIKKKPQDKHLSKAKVLIYRKLGWDEWATRLEVDVNLLENTKPGRY